MAYQWKALVFTHGDCRLDIFPTNVAKMLRGLNRRIPVFFVDSFMNCEAPVQETRTDSDHRVLIIRKKQDSQAQMKRAEKINGRIQDN